MEMLYAKYNRHRLPGFQTETTIWRSGGRRFVLKKALGPEAVPHLQMMRAQVGLVGSCLRGDRLRLPEVTALDGQTLRFDFVEGLSLDSMLFSAFGENDKTQFLRIVSDYVDLLHGAFATAATPVWTDIMGTVFGVRGLADFDGLGPFLIPALADPVFENILVNGRQFYLVDQEWVFEGCLPVSFVMFRSLFYFYEKNKEFGLEEWLPLAQVLEKFSVEPQVVRRYHEMDEAFQAYVFGRERCFRYKDNYVKYAHSLPSLLETVASQQRAINVMQNSRSWQLGQKAGRLMDARFPPGTRRRRFVEGILRRLPSVL